MECKVLYKQDGHIWYAFGQDPAKPDNIIDTNQIVICSGDDTVLLDPGGMEIFPNFLAAVTEKISIESIKHIFLSHQDPDIGSSLSLWRRICNDDVKIYLPWMWAGFVAHFDVKATLIPVPDEGMTIRLSNGRSLDMIPAHFLHSPGNLHMYDPHANVLFSGDIGAALLPAEARNGFFVEKFDQHVQYMKGFHERWLGFAEARDAWVEQVRRLNPAMIVPQHGLFFKDDNVGAFLDWLAGLEIGKGVSAMSGDTERSVAPKDTLSTPKSHEKTKTVMSTPPEPASYQGSENRPSDPKPGNADGSLVIKDDATLYARLGGDPAIDVVVDSFYSRVLADPRLSGFFENTDTDHLAKMQKQFMAKAFGGPDPYTGQDLRTAHERLVAEGLNNSHFAMVAEHLLDVLKNFQVDPVLIDEVMQIVGSTRDDILNL